MCLHRWKRCSQDGTPTGSTEGCKVCNLSSGYKVLRAFHCGLVQLDSSFALAVCHLNATHCICIGMRCFTVVLLLLQPGQPSLLSAHAWLFVSVLCANEECADAVCRLKASDLLQKQEDLAAKVSTKRWPSSCLLRRIILSNVPLMKAKFSKMLARIQDANCRDVMMLFPL